MPDNPLRFYLDEQMPLVIARQVRRLGIEVVTARDLNALGDSDENHLKRAADMGYVLCTLDDDFLALAAAGSQHAGIVYGIAEIHTIGDWVRFLELMHGVYEAEEMINRVEFL